MKVLLVDDSSTMRKIQKRAIRKFEAVEDIFEAADGQQALEILKENHYNFGLVLCDINMPNVSGIEVLKAIRSDQESAGLPVIMCTSVADKKQVIDALRAGATSYVVKPFKPANLCSKIEEIIGNCPA